MESIFYEVTEKDSFGKGYLYKDSNPQNCIKFVKRRLRERNKKDGYDEYWHNVDIKIVKKEIKESDYMYL